MASQAWAGSNRRARLPKNWPTIRKHVLERDDFSCQFITDSGIKCLNRANQVDHIVPNDDDSYTNLRALCEWHHNKVSGRQGAAAFMKQRRETRQRFNAPRHEAHPGLTHPG